MRVVDGLVVLISLLQTWQCVEGECDGGQDDEEDGNDGNDLGSRRQATKEKQLSLVARTIASLHVDPRIDRSSARTSLVPIR